jgi:PAS domain S-box-containing protein
MLTEVTGRRLMLALLTVQAVLIAIFAASVWLRAPGAYLPWADGIIYPLIHLLTVGILVPRAGQGGPQARAWGILGVAYLCYALGEVWWALAGRFVEEPPPLTIEDALWLLYYPLVFWSIGHLTRKGRNPDQRRHRNYLDALVIGSGAFVLIALLAQAWQIDLAQAEPDSSVMLTGIYVGLDLVMIVLSLLLAFVQDFRVPRGWWLLMAGLLTFGLADTFFWIQLAQEAYVEGGWLDLGWPLASLSISGAALAGLPPLSTTQSRTLRGILPASLAVLAAALALHWAGEGPFALFARVAATASLFLALLRLTYAIRDATLAEAAAQASKDRSDHLLRIAPVPLGLTDAQDRIRLVNDAYERLFGFGQAEVPLLRDWYRRVYPDPAYRREVRTLWEESIRQALAGQGSIGPQQCRITRRDGEIRHVEISAVELDGGLLTTFIDVTARKAAEERLRQSEQRYRLIAENSSDVIWILGLDGRFTYVSPSVTRLRGFTVDEVMRQSLEETLPPDSLALALAHLEHYRTSAALGELAEYVREELEQWRKDGTRVWTEVQASPLIDDQGTFAAILGVSRDITERRRYEDDLRQARERAEEASRAKSEFLAHMSHEIRTPLYSVLGLAQLVSREPLSTNQHGMIDRIQEAGQTLLGIISDIQDLSRIEAGKLIIEPHSFELEALLAKVAALFAPKARAQGLRLRIQPPLPAPGLLRGDALRLEQVLNNLVGNAIKFTDMGEVEVEAQVVARSNQEVRLRFSIHDTGGGIAPEVLARLFTPFTQGDPGITRRHGGTGLGLAISKRLVMLMGGEIGAESQPGHGSTFWFEIPFPLATPTYPDALVLPAPAQTGGVRLRGLRCLVVDDSDTHCELMAQALAQEGALVTTVADGQQAVQLLEARPGGWDLVMLDMQMPVMDGLTATRVIRGSLGLETLPIIALTAGVLPEQRQAAREAGVDAVLTKPVDLDQIASLLRQWLPALTSSSTLHPASAPNDPGPSRPGTSA